MTNEGPPLIDVDLSRYTVALTGWRMVLVCRRCVNTDLFELGATVNEMNVERITNLIREHEGEVHGNG